MEYYKYSEDQPYETPSAVPDYGSDEGLEMLSYPRGLSAVPNDLQEVLEEDLDESDES